MAQPIITLTTDFGLVDSYVAQMKGVILGIDRSALIVDVTHEIPPQDIVRGAAILQDCVRAFPAGTIHVCVVDPGVGSARRIVAVEAGGQRFVGPDNGLFSFVTSEHSPQRVVELKNSAYWRQPVSTTFHGRDIMAPVAAHWSLGVDAARFGDVTSQALVELEVPAPYNTAEGITGVVLWADAYGNLVTNIAENLLPIELRDRLVVEIGDVRIQGVRRFYADGLPEKLIALIGSSGRLEIAVNKGSAAERLPGGEGMEVRVFES